MIGPFTEHSNLQMHCLPECRNTTADLSENKEDTAIDPQPAVSRQGILVRWSICCILVCITPSDIVDLPCLSHLILPWDTTLPDVIWKMKALRTLRSFILAENLPENIRSLGKLNKLEDLQFECRRQMDDDTPTTAWMDALIFSLEKLSNLKRFALASYSIAVGADALLLLSPPFQNIELLALDGLIFSRVPRWIRGLQKLRQLSIGVKQMPQEDIDIIGTLPCLIFLELWIPGMPTGRMVIGGTTRFNALEQFVFNCDVASYLTFEDGAMPSLRELWLYLDSHKWDKATPLGLQYLSSLKKITVLTVPHYYSNEMTDGKNSDESALIRRLFQEAAGAHSNHPFFGGLGQVWSGVRPREEAQE